MKGLMFRTIVVLAILLTTLAAAGYLAAHNVSVAPHYTVWLLSVGIVARLVLEMKVWL
jgi:hypothetical protein